MLAPEQTRLVTADELLHIPDDSFRYELIQGELRKMPPAGFEHGTLAMGLGIYLGSYVMANSLGEVCAAETGFQLSVNPDTVRAADVAFVRRERVQAIGKIRSYWPGAPDLAAEVVSPNDKRTEVAEKVEAWLKAGTRMVLVVDPRRRTITVYRTAANPTTLTVQDILDGADVVPGWTLPVAHIFK